MSRNYGFTKEKLLELHFGKNLSCVEISKIYNCHRDTVLQALKRYGIKPRGRIRKPLSDEIKSKIITLYVEQKLSTRQIGKILGKTHDYVSDKLKEIGIDVDDRIASLQSERNPCWKNGKTIINGYISVSSSKVGVKGEQEHRIVMENYLGRKLKKGEVVHHIDGDKTNNNINNLALMDISAHTRLHALERWKENKEMENK